MITNRIYSFLGILFGLLFVFNGNVWGTNAEWDWSTDNLSSTTKGQITMSYGDGGASTSTTVSGTPSTLRLYSNKTTGHGGWIKFTAASGYQITSVSVTAADNPSKARYGVDAANVNTAVTSSFSYSSGSATVSNLTASTFTIKNGHTGQNTATLRFSSITVTYSSTCDKSVTVSSGSSSTNGSISTITGSPVATCDASASNRTVTITVSPNTGYVAPTNLSFSVTSGNAVTATKQSGPTNNVYVYSFAQNDNNSTCEVNVACVGKQCTLIFDQNSGTGGQTSNLTATYGSAMPAISGVPTREHYDFEGYYDGAGGTGNKYYNSDGTSATNWNKNTTANTTLYAKWTEHSLTNYRTVCCTELGTIEGEATLTQGGNSVTISGWSDVSNVGTYTVKLYKKNGANWDLVSGTTSGGSAGVQGTRTGITSGSKSVTYTGLEVESEYKFTVQAIAGSSAYCDGVETDVTEINDVDVSSTPFKFRYAIYIDDGTNDNYTYHYITSTGNTNEGSVDIDLSAHVDYYQFKIAGGFSGWWGQTGTSKIPASTEWELDGSNNVRLESGAGGSYTFTVDYSSTNPAVTVTFPSADQDADYKIYFDKSAVADWGATLKYRIGNGSHNQNQNFTLVPGTDQFYVTTTPSYGSMDAWQIANNVAWSGTNSIYNYYHGDGNDITRATVYQDYAVDEDITIVPTSIHNTENSCQFWDVSKTSGMLTHTATITTPSHGTINIAYTDVSGTSQPTNTSTVADLAHRTILTITATPATGYTCTSLTVNGAAFTSGSTHILAADATIAATFTAQTSTVTLDNNNATSGSQQTVTATYDATMPLVTTADGTPAVAALTRTGYTFNGWWDETSGGNQYYTYSGSPKVIASARTWDKTGAQTLKAQWIVNQYTLTWDLQGGTVATAGTGAAAAATGTPSSSQDYGTALTAPVVTKTGYNFNVWSPSVAATMPPDNTTYTASWTAQVYNITYKDQGDNAYSGNATAGVPTGAPTTHTYGSATALVNGVKDGYRFDGWFTDASCTVSAGSSIGATAKTADFTLYAKWTQVYTVTWSVNGDTWETGVVDGNTYVPSGSKVSALPTAPTKSDCDDSKVFVGWKAAEIDGTSAGDPGGIFTNVAGSPEISANTTFYAVFADESGGDFTRVTSTSQLAAGKQIVMGYEETANSGIIIPVQSNTYYSDKNILYTGTTNGAAGTGTITISSNPDVTNYLFTLRAGYNSGYWAFEMSGTLAGEYIGYLGKNTIQHYEGIQTDGKTDFSITFGTNDTASIVNKYGTANYITESGKNKYYKYVSYNYNNGNPRVSIYQTRQTSALVLYIANPLVYSNYVTSCSSCDADATFTNTTPAVSDIDCTSATLTATGGLATVGADGCHVSDYGFVIGTSDNPAIGGSGVTKLQVGTSDPTIGEDFSYDATGLTKGTHYYIRAYAINRHGTAYSSSQNFWTNNVSSIAITTAPTKTNYIVGETFDATGMVVTATMADTNTEDVTSDVTYSSSALTAGTSQNFPVNYTLCETEKSVNQVINVYTLTVTEGTNPEYGTATNSSANIVSITGLGDHKTYTVTVTSSNATAVDNGDNTWSIINPTGNVTVRVDYADAVQVKVYYKVDGVTVTGLTQDVYQSETTTLPTASELATAMTAQSMDIPDDDYPNFIGWSETEFPAQTAEPSIVTGTPTINAEKTYYAVYTNLSKKQILPNDFGGSYATNEGAKTIDGLGYNILDICLQSSNIQFKSTPGYLYSTSALSYIKKIEITGLDLVVNACSDASGTVDGSAITPTGTGTYVYTFPAEKQYFKIKGKGGTDQVSLIEIFYASSTVYYMTQFCTNRVTLTQNSPEHGTVEFSRTSLVTCGSDKEVSLTITPAAGYQLSSYEVATGSGKVAAKSVSPAIALDNNSSAAQNITLTFAEDANGAYDVTASFTEMVASAWTWTKHVGGATITTEPVEVYVGQKVQVDVSYEPAGLLSNHTNASAYNYSPSPWSNPNLGSPAKAGDHLTVTGTNAGSTSVVLNHNDGLTKTINYTVLALPLVHFVDNIHGETFANVVATVSGDGWTVTTTLPTPTHSAVDDPGGSYNTCERQHLHLIGWIESEWADAHPNATHSEIIGANASNGEGTFLEAGADFNVETYNGKTYYAVWSIIE